jgi:LysR family transcriptional regulator, transcriptional activator of nhaA
VGSSIAIAFDVDCRRRGFIVDWLNYHHLLNFWLVAREGGIQPASRVLHVSPASVSIQVRQLERTLGVKLFEKQGRRLVLTGMGELVADYADDIFQTGRELMETVKGNPAGRPMVLRVGVADVMPKLVAFQLLHRAFREELPIRLVCHEGEMSRLMADLAIHKLDLVLSDSGLPASSRIRAYSNLLGESEVVLVGSQELVGRYRNGFPGSLDKAPMLLPTENNVLRAGLEQWFDQQGIQPTVIAEFADSAMLKIAGRHGLGFFAVPELILDEVTTMYSVQRLGAVSGVMERFFALSVDRKQRHPALAAIIKSSS